MVDEVLISTGEERVVYKDSFDWVISSQDLYKSGLEITIPWSQIRSVSFKKQGICFYTRPKRSRWLPLRMLSKAQQKDLKNLVAETSLISSAP